MTTTAQLILDPPLARKGQEPGVLQTIRLVEGGATLASARWRAWPDVAEGVVEIIELTVKPNHRRRGHGRALLQAIIHQSEEHHRFAGSHLRRLWVCIGQKSQVLARSFLTGAGFHHVGTIPSLFRDEDGLIYTRSFD